jgi:hypothetical protein
VWPVPQTFSEKNKMSFELKKLPDHDGEFRADLHLHLETTRRKDLKSLVGEILEKGVNLLAISNHSDSESSKQDYEGITSHTNLGGLPNGWSWYKDQRITFIEMPRVGKLYFLKGEEAQTKKGHVLFLGLKEGDRACVRKDPLSTIVQTLDMDSDLITVLPHPMAPSIGCRNDLEFLKDKIDALEHNLYLIGTNDKTLAYGRLNYIPVLANSDAHYDFRNLGESFNIFDAKGFQYEDGDSFIGSLKQNIRERNYLCKIGEIPLVSKLKLSMQCLWYLASGGKIKCL